MNKERLQEIKDSIDLQLTVAKSIGTRDELAEEEKELYDEVVRLDNVINELKEYINKNIEITKVAVSFNEGTNDAYEVKKYKRDIDLFTMVLDKLKELKEEK